jgi:hypothetical protein
MRFRKLGAIWLWFTLIYIFVLQSVHTLPVRVGRALGICMATSFTLQFVLGPVLNTAWLSFQADFSCNNRSNVSVALLVIPLGTLTSDTLQGSSSYYSVWILWPVWKQWSGSPSWEAYSGSVDQEIFAWYGTRSFSVITRFIWELKQPFEAHCKLTYCGY